MQIFLMSDSVKHNLQFLSRKDKWRVSGFYAICLTLFLMPFPRSWSLYPLGASLFSGLVIWLTDTRNIYSHFKKEFARILPLIIYFCLYLLYFLFDSRWTYLEDKLMFLLIPLFGFPIIYSDFLKKNFQVLLISFIAGIVVICIYQLLRATFESISVTNGIIKIDPIISSGISRYNWIQLSSFEHPTYLAMKILWAIALLLSAAHYTRLSKLAITLIIIFLTVFLFLLSSRSGIFVLIIILVYFIYTRLRTIRNRIFLVLMIPLILFGSFKLTSLSQRMNLQLAVIKSGISDGNFDWKNIDPRTRAWYSALTLIKQRPLFGVGLDARDKLTEVYKSKGFEAEAVFRLNAHNQYLESQLTFGFSGTIIVLWMLFTLLLRRKKILYPSLVMPFLTIVSISMIFESILVRQWGIMFFVLFYCILIIPERDTSTS